MRTTVTSLVRTGRDDDVSELRHIRTVEGSLEEWIPVKEKREREKEKS